MRTAPAVWAPLHACGPERVLIAGLYALAGAALGAGLSAHLQAHLSLPLGPGWRWAAAAVGAVLMAGAGAWLAQRALPGDGEHLRWDASTWTLALRPDRPDAGGLSEQAVVRVDVALDLGAWLLLRLKLGNGQRCWQPVRARTVGPAWHGLRVALRAHAGPAGVPAAAPAAAAP